jgi:hypothetical protein
MPATLNEKWNFDDTDLSANRMGQLTQKQKDLLAEKAKSHKSSNTIIGIVIAVIFGGTLLTAVFVPILAAVAGSYLENGGITPQAMQISLLLICVGLFVLVLFGVGLIFVLRFIFARANRKVDLAVRRIEGSVNFVWVERRHRNTSKSGPTYKTVRVLEMRIAGETFSIDNDLPNIINQGEEWVFYYTNHPFLFLSAEKTSQGK